MIRTAMADDLDEIVGLMRAFHAASPYSSLPYDPEGFREFAAKLIEAGVIFLSDHGFIGGLINPLYFNPAIKSGAELFWWAPQEGRALRLAFEEWAKGHGAEIVQFSGLIDDDTDRIRRLYARAGFEPVETGYLKRL